MSEFVRLTGLGSALYIRGTAIQALFSDGRPGHENKTWVYVGSCTEESQFVVRETPEEVMRLIEIEEVAR